MTLKRSPASLIRRFMAHHYAENFFTKAFTPREYQVELLAAAKENNIIVCLGNGPNKVFIILKLIQELANGIRRPYRRGGRRTVLLTSSVSSLTQHALSIKHLTDLKVGEYSEPGQPLDLNNHQVLIMTSDMALEFILHDNLKLSDMNLLIVDDCHMSIRDHSMHQVMEALWRRGGDLARLRVLGLTWPLVPGPGPGGAEPGCLEAEIQRLEATVRCRADTASDIVSTLRYCAKPKEIIIECDEFSGSELSSLLEEQVLLTREFLDDHRYDPSEIYDEEYMDDLVNIPSPKEDPNAVLRDFHHVLSTMGPWCADKAALVLLIQIEKLKVKTPYERHFLLLCMVSSVMLKIRAICDNTLQGLEEKEKINKCSSPKVLRLLEVLRNFKPKSQPSNLKEIENGNEETSESGESNRGLAKELENRTTVCVCSTNKIGDEILSKYSNSGLPNRSMQCVCSSTNKIGEEMPCKREEHNSKLANGLGNRRTPCLCITNKIGEESESEEHYSGLANGLGNKSTPCLCNTNKIDDEMPCENGERHSGLANGLENRSTPCLCSTNKIDKEIPYESNTGLLQSMKEQGKVRSDEEQAHLNEPAVQAHCTCYEIENVNGEIEHLSVIDKLNSSVTIIDKEFMNKKDSTAAKKIQQVKVVPNPTDLFLCETKQLTNGTGICSADSLQNEKKENLVSEGQISEINQDKSDNNLCQELVTLSHNNHNIQEVCSSVLNSLDSSALPLSDCPDNKATSGDKVKSSKNGLEDIDGAGRGVRLRGRGKGWRFQKKNFTTPRNKVGSQEDVENICAIIFVENPFTAKMLFHLLNELRRCDPDFAYISPQYTVGKVANPITEPREAEVEHRKQEEVLKRFRIRECNVLISTSILEEGIDLPKCNLVIRYDVPKHYRSYAQSKGRARAQDSHFMIMVEQFNTGNFISNFAQFIEIERMLLARCTNREPTDVEESEADKFSSCVPPFSPGLVPVTLSSAIALVNRYCAKLPSDSFTRLTPLWSVQPLTYLGQPMYYCTVRLPINSPVKQDIIGHPMPSRVLAQRVAALETCRVLHASRELDDSLQPIGKESLMTTEEDEDDSEKASADPLEPRPGTTKRRQYYYKRIASALSECRPVEGQPCHLYSLQMVLTCPLPEEQNTRGRKLHPPEDAPQGFGILTTKTMPKICPFPIFTRSGEVRVSLELRQVDLVLTQVQLMMISTFLNYTFTSVLRLQKYLMLFDPTATENSYLVVPTKNGGDKTLVDWEFLELIYSKRQEVLSVIPDKDRVNFAFEPEKYHDAVVMPWYRNQDQPQYFYVAEICSHLNPKSSFPGSDYQTFEEYYMKKYGISIQNNQQPLLDVDHTSARLNFLTPRYVNRKGVALPTSSEETKRAKRENLEQKQILVPELCMIHPFPASLWRQAVCLPCVLYRTNALLLADEIRTKVAEDLHLGLLSLPRDFHWGPLDFGWSLADVLKKSKEENEKNVTALKIKSGQKPIEDYEDIIASVVKKDEVDEISDASNELQEEQDESWMEIGTWSNEMAGSETDSNPNTNMVVRYGSPTSWQQGGVTGDGGGMELCLYDSDVESDMSSEPALSSGRSSPQRNGLRITFTGDYLAEAEDDNYEQDEEIEETDDWEWRENSALDLQQDVERETKKFEEATEKNIEVIKSSGMLVKSDVPLVIVREAAKDQSVVTAGEADLGFTLSGYGMPSDMMSQLIPSNNNCFSSADSALDSDSDISDGDSLSSSGDEDESSLMLLSFDEQPDLESHPGPSPSLLLQALTMSNANDGINLERLETIGDSFLKYAITTYLYCAHETVHEGKLSHLRSKQVSNLNLYRLGKRKLFGESMIATKFEPHDNWLPPCYQVPRELERALVEAGLPACLWSQAEIPELCDMTRDQMVAVLQERAIANSDPDALDDSPCFVPYNLITQHSIPDKSIADCVEALIGAYLIACGPRGALLFMSWLGIRVLPHKEVTASVDTRPVGSILINEQNGQLWYGVLPPPKSPLVRHVPDPEGELARLLDGFNMFERRLSYRFRDRSYLLQAMTHASYSPNRLTDCYQRLEFLGDAVLDYLITRHLYEDKRQHCPGALTDLRSALVNNTIFASLAVRHGFHKYFRHLSPGLAEVVERFVRIQEENGHAISEEYYLIGEDECEEAEDVEVPKALGDVFESVAGAIFLDSGMSLDSVWKVYYRMMKTEIEQFSTNVPKSPIRELLELEPETAKFGKPEKLADGRRVRVTVEVFGKGSFKGIGRNYRIAKCTAAKCALKQLKKRGLLAKKLNGAQPW